MKGESRGTVQQEAVPSHPRSQRGQGSGGREDKEMKCLLQSQIVRVGEKDFRRKAIHFSTGQGDWIINRFENLIKSIVPFFHKCHTYHTLHLYSVCSII